MENTEQHPKLVSKEESEAISKFLDKISETETTMTDRDLSTYLREFRLSVNDLPNKKILDIGSGKQERFSKEASEFGAEVFSINPALQKKEARNDVKENITSNVSGKKLEWQERSFAGRGQELPFQDDTFDVVTSLYAVPYFIDSEKGRAQALREIIRVLKSDGKAIIAPGIGIESQTLTDLLGEEGMYWLKKQNCNISARKGEPVIITKHATN
ncbi:MAG: class I SAM-dependent methyltransferase [Candidatus Liptonbacteria bacterium]|nr:class I SAM-dependent methyltransferase [Candidatus Liptonbacteria bacterium]